ncbi:MAG: hypothetical protein JWL83_66 [Actinomycetia bacterium]|nr:hypothetical protein [Actinomycetes bacterium]
MADLTPVIAYDPDKFYTPEEQAENRIELCRALESGDYHHGKGALKNEDGTMCCLGVSLDLIDPNGWLPVSVDETRHQHRLGAERSRNFTYMDEEERTIYPDFVVLQQVYGIDELFAQRRLADTNDAEDTTSYAPVISLIAGYRSAA